MYTYTKQRVKRKQMKLTFANFTYTSMIFEITWFWLLSQIFQFYTISPKIPLNKDKNADILRTPGSTSFII